MMKRCETCKQTKPHDAYSRNRKRPDGLAGRCKSCVSEKRKQWYASHYDAEKLRVNAGKARRRRLAAAHVRQVKASTPCVDCGRSGPWYCMDFDHLRDKTMDVSRLVTSGPTLATLEAEIQKCEVVCAWCHRIRTFTRNPKLYKLTW